jgi:hypothetical protein
MLTELTMLPADAMDVFEKFFGILIGFIAIKDLVGFCLESKTNIQQHHAVAGLQKRMSAGNPGWPRPNHAHQFIHT